MTPRDLLLLVTAAGALAGPGQACAEDATARQLAEAVRPSRETNLAALAPRAQPDERPAGVAKTSVEGRFADDQATAAFGFLCGRPDAAGESGRAMPTGSDPHGRFVGARLSIALR